jgi:hypothetical protein
LQDENIDIENETPVDGNTCHIFLITISFTAFMPLQGRSSF